MGSMCHGLSNSVKELELHRQQLVEGLATESDKRASEICHIWQVQAELGLGVRGYYDELG